MREDLRGAAVAYVMAAAFFSAAIWLSWDWSWAARAPVLAYLAVCSLLFPLAKIPADLLIAGYLLSSFIRVTGLIAWFAWAAVYVVAWVCAPLLAPFGVFTRWASTKLGPHRSRRDR